MNNEIKEILDYLKEFIDEDRLEQINLNRWFVSSLLDYITNLQEENNKLKNLEYKFFDCSGDEESFTLNDYLELGNKVYDLQEENERLQKQLEYLRTDEYLNQVKWERNFNETMNKELKTRIEKAVEYIKEYTFREEIGFDNKKGEIHYGYFLECKVDELLDILNGRSDI